MTSHELIGATTTQTGLSIHAELDTDDYPTGVKIPDATMKSLETTGNLVRHDFHGEWNFHADLG